MNKPKTYRALQMLSTIYFIFAGLVFLVGIIIGGITAITPSVSLDFTTGGIVAGPPMVVPGIAVIVSTVFVAITLAASAQIVQVILEMLANSRAQTQYLRILAQQSKERV
jgi:hypothetical protein